MATMVRPCNSLRCQSPHPAADRCPLAAAIKAPGMTRDCCPCSRRWETTTRTPGWKEAMRISWHLKTYICHGLLPRMCVINGVPSWWRYVYVSDHRHWTRLLFCGLLDDIANHVRLRNLIGSINIGYAYLCVHLFGAEVELLLENLIKYHGCWCPGSLRRQAISSDGIDYAG